MSTPDNRRASVATTPRALPRGGQDPQQAIRDATPKRDSPAGPSSDETNLVPTPKGDASRRPNSQQPTVVPSPTRGPAAGSNSDETTRIATPRGDPSRRSDVAEQPDQERSVTQTLRVRLLCDPVLGTLALGLSETEQIRIATAHRCRILTEGGPDELEARNWLGLKPDRTEAKDGVERGYGLPLNHPAVAAVFAQLDTLGFLEKQMASALRKQLRVHPLHPWINSPRGHRQSPLHHSPAAVRYALENSGLTQAQLAAELGRSQGYVSEILKGTRNANPALLREIAVALNCPIVVLEAKRQLEPTA